jgi:membrane protein implicated in regulation of membrane protease activity
VIVLGVLGVAALVAGAGFVAIGVTGGLVYGVLFAVLFFLVALYAYSTQRCGRRRRRPRRRLAR